MHAAVYNDFDDYITSVLEHLRQHRQEMTNKLRDRYDFALLKKRHKRIQSVAEELEELAPKELLQDSSQEYSFNPFDQVISFNNINTHIYIYIYMYVYTYIRNKL
jgi:hypothetical protein